MLGCFGQLRIVECSTSQQSDLQTKWGDWFSDNSPTSVDRIHVHCESTQHQPMMISCLFVDSQSLIDSIEQCLVGRECLWLVFFFFGFFFCCLKTGRKPIENDTSQTSKARYPTWHIKKEGRDDHRRWRELDEFLSSFLGWETKMMMDECPLIEEMD